MINIYYRQHARRLTWQLGDRKSQSLIVLSNEPEMNVSSTGDMESDVTLETKKQTAIVYNAIQLNS